MTSDLWPPCGGQGKKRDFPVRIHNFTHLFSMHIPRYAILQVKIFSFLHCTVCHLLRFQLNVLTAFWKTANSFTPLWPCLTVSLSQWYLLLWNRLAAHLLICAPSYISAWTPGRPAGSDLHLSLRSPNGQWGARIHSQASLLLIGVQTCAGISPHMQPCKVSEESRGGVF